MTTTPVNRLGLAALAVLFVACGDAAAAEPSSAPGDRHSIQAVPPPASPRPVGPRLGSGESRAPPRRTMIVQTAEALRLAVAEARPGTVIEIQPGTYDFTGVRIEAAQPGRADLPIVVRARVLGDVRLRFALLEGFHVVAPYWTFENLVVEGVCEHDHDCEHAFHVVGEAVGTVIQNNWVTDFNAAVKVNGRDGHYPDDGLIRHNAFLNAWPRDTDRPVTVLDIVSVSRWRVQRNLIADFAKDGGNHTSYGAFFKGAGEDNVFEQNLVLCEQRHAGQQRVGFSFGGGRTGRRFCRDGSCSVEHRRGIARHNVIMDCPNAAGIHLNKSADTLIHNNALIGTRGIELRDAVTDAEIVNNIVDGRIWAQGGADFTAAGNIVAPGASGEVYRDAAAGDLRLKNGESILGSGVRVKDGADFCGQPYDAAQPDIGPIQYSAGSTCAAALW